MVAVLAVSIAVLQVEASVALPCGVAAADLNPFRCASKDDFNVGSTCGAALAIFVRQASYFVMYSSHSGTPTESPAGAVFAVSAEFAGAVVAVVLLVVVVVDVVAVLAALFAVALAVVFAAPPPQPNEIKAKHVAIANAKKVLIVIILIFLTENNFLRLTFINERNEDKEHPRLLKRKKSTKKC